MDQPATDTLRFASLGALPLSVDFQGGRLISDGGWCRVAEADTALELSAPVAALTAGVAPAAPLPDCGGLCRSERRQCVAE